MCRTHQTLCALAFSAAALRGAVGVWPQPLHTEFGTPARARRLVGAAFTCTIRQGLGSASGAGAGSEADILAAACARYESYARSEVYPVSRRRYSNSHGYSDGGGGHALSEDVTGIVVSAEDTSSVFAMGTNESYTLSIPASGTPTLRAAHVVGVLRGLETFFQLLEPLAPAVFTLRAPCAVVDAPRWPHRGLLLDTGKSTAAAAAAAPDTLAATLHCARVCERGGGATLRTAVALVAAVVRGHAQFNGLTVHLVPTHAGRHFYPVAFIKHVIEGMAMEKLSVLHWHITVCARAQPSRTPTPCAGCVPASCCPPRLLPHHDLPA